MIRKIKQFLITLSSVCNFFPYEDWGIFLVLNSSYSLVSTRCVRALITKISTCSAPSQPICPASIINCHSLNFNFSWCHCTWQVDFFLFCSYGHLWDNASKWMSHKMAKQLLLPYYQNLLGMWPIVYTVEKNWRTLCSTLDDSTMKCSVCQ